MTESAVPESEHELAQLLAACARQDRQAFQRLYELTAAQLLACLIRILSNRALAEEALQDAFVQVWRRAGEFQSGRGSSWAWVVSIARYRAIDLQRRERRLAAGASEGIEEIADNEESYDERMALGHRVATALDRCLAALQPRQRSCIVLAYQDGLRHAEVAGAIGEPLGSVKSWIRRGLTSLKRCLES